MLAEYYNWFKVFHIIFVICWMAAIFYLPRLFVYHTKAILGSELDLMLRTMERRLSNMIMTPAMIITYIFGFILAYIYGFVVLGMWFYVKLLAVFVLTLVHGFLLYCRNNFAVGKNKYTEKFYRILNEAPTILLIVIVWMVIIKPFE